jgi:hydroxylaminobenzene mutase
MDSSVSLQRQGHRLLQLGILQFLLALILGIFVPAFAVPRLALSAHLLGIMQGLFLMVTGVIWPRLKLSRTTSRVTFGLSLYGCFVAWLTNVVAATLGAGHLLLPMAAGPARGTELQEQLIAMSLRTTAVALIAASGLILWGLRALPGEE